MMQVPWKRPGVPAAVKAAVRLEGAERVIEAASCGVEGWAVGTDRALYLVDPEPDPGSTRRLRWDLIDKATWEPPLLAIDVRPRQQDRPERLVIEVDATSTLPAVIRDRVTNSIVVNSQLDVPGGTARVLARRNFDTGLLQWRVVFSEGVNAADPDVRAAADRELADLRSRLGV